MGVPVLALFRENKIRDSQYYSYSRNLNPSKFMPYTVFQTSSTSVHSHKNVTLIDPYRMALR